ncbi:Protein of unknown function (DUF938) [Acidovorax sp. CF316]|uniref:DUF938 domain-containing protein n=1 Tax=Acidovorax sp. CF316 TaxID=1144317 RepID=UPI00026BD426|nr:DUF938 domain-containing protein [Acidovorax sp. CF316]EJE50088.1 Protein of unknown function (DUF938) [Acidovorax sp. CF316]
MTAPALPCSPASERNQPPILAVLRGLLPDTGTALEIASGTGQHAAFFGAALPGWAWQPTDLKDELFFAIAGWALQAGATNVQPAVLLDVRSGTWPDGQAPFAQPFDLIYCANMLHIAPWACCAGLMQGAARHLAPGGRLVTYGPYIEDGVPTSPGNQGFDATLRAQNPAWGIRNRADVEREAAAAGLHLAERHAMPSNNLLLVWQRTPAPGNTA